jgi:hypothetical protein
VIVAVPVCVALIITATAAIIITRRDTPAYSPGHSRRPAPARAEAAPPPAARRPGPCSPAEMTVLDMPPALARTYAPQAAGPRENRS